MWKRGMEKRGRGGERERWVSKACHVQIQNNTLKEFKGQ